MKKLSLGLVVVLAVILAISSAFTTKKTTQTQWHEVTGYTFTSYQGDLTRDDVGSGVNSPEEFEQADCGIENDDVICGVLFDYDNAPSAPSVLTEGSDPGEIEDIAYKLE